MFPAVASEEEAHSPPMIEFEKLLIFLWITLNPV